VGTTLLFTLSKFLISLYLGTASFEFWRRRLGGDRARVDLLLVVHPIFGAGSRKFTLVSSAPALCEQRAVLVAIYARQNSVLRQGPINEGGAMTQ
jgi:hypothetical protein